MIAKVLSWRNCVTIVAVHTAMAWCPMHPGCLQCPGHLQGWGLSLGRILDGASMDLLGGGSSQRAVSTLLPANESPPSPGARPKIRAKNENEIFVISMSRGFRKVISRHVFGEKN